MLYVTSFVRYFIAVCLEILNLLTAYMLCNMYLVLTITFSVFFSEGLQLFLYGEMLVLLIKLTSCLACYFLIAFIIRICASSFMYY